MLIANAENHFKKGMAAVVAKDHARAAKLFRTALDIEREHGVPRSDGRYLSFYGLSVARADRPTPESIKACETAVKLDEFNAVLRLNLGRVYLLAGRNSKALETLAHGLRSCPHDRTLRKELKKIDRRARRPLRMFARSHPLNRWLGRVRFALRRDSARDKMRTANVRV